MSWCTGWAGAPGGWRWCGRGAVSSRIRTELQAAPPWPWQTCGPSLSRAGHSHGASCKLLGCVCPQPRPRPVPGLQPCPVFVGSVPWAQPLTTRANTPGPGSPPGPAFLRFPCALGRGPSDPSHGCPYSCPFSRVPSPSALRIWPCEMWTLSTPRRQVRVGVTEKHSKLGRK